MADLQQTSNGSVETTHFKIPEIKFTKLFINGESVDSIKGRTFETVDPRTGEVIARITEGDKEDIDAAVKAAREAFDHGPWPRMSGIDDMRIAREEIFGPVLSLMKFKTIDEAIERANDTTYGLAAGVVTKDLNVANKVSRSVRAGIIWINCYGELDLDFPFGGYKMSGFGRALGIDGLHKYLQVKTVVTPLQDSPWL